MYDPYVFIKPGFHSFFRPVVVMALVMNILQLVVAKFAFLQERGEFLAIDNRLVVFYYFGRCAI